ncbi:interferon lambda-4-like [Rhynchocyon petersi]
MEDPGITAEGAEMRPVVQVTVALALCVLVTVGQAVDPTVRPPPRRCLLSHYRSLDPQVLSEIKALKDSYEEDSLGWRMQNCSFRPQRSPPPPSSCARLRLVARGLAEAQAVLSSQHRPQPLPGTHATLELLAAVRRDVAACLELVRPGSSRKSLRPLSRRHKARREESPQCREATVIFNLLRLLMWDLRLVAHSGPCV